MLKTLFILFSFGFWGIYFYNESKTPEIIQPAIEIKETVIEKVHTRKKPASIPEVEKKEKVSLIDQLMMEKLGFILDISSIKKLDSKEEVIAFIELHTKDDCFPADSKIRCLVKTSNCLLEKEKSQEDHSFCAALRTDCIKETTTSHDVEDLANHLLSSSKENLQKAQDELKEYISNHSKIKECEVEKEKKEDYCELVDKELCITLDNEKTEAEETPIQSYYCLTKNLDQCIMEH